jgi:hypothetical protein
VLIGLLVAIKPNFLVWPVLLLVAGYGGVAAAALVVAGCLSVLPALVYGPGIYAQWLHAVQLYSFPGLIHNASLTGVAVRLGVPGAGPVVSSAILALLAFWIWRRRPSPLDVSALALVGALVAAPLAWIGYSLLVVPVFLGRTWTPMLRAAAALLAVPPPLIIALSGGPHGASAALIQVAGLPYALGLLLALVALLTGYRVPLVDGTASPRRGSSRVAASSALANALKSASTLWWAFRPATTRAWTLILPSIASDSKKWRNMSASTPPTISPTSGASTTA